MPKCEVCENDYDKAFEIVVGGERHIFDSFEYAITPWRLFARTAIAVSSATASKRTDKSSVVSIAHARPAQRVKGPRLKRARRSLLAAQMHCAIDSIRSSLMRLDLDATAKYRC